MSEQHGPGRACHCRPWCGLPPCRGCGEDHGGNDGLCRDCWRDWRMALMQCSGCKRMRYDNAIIGPIWGDPCACDPRPPSMHALHNTPTGLGGEG